ncbi:MAG: Nramp family divalent metal transporter [Deltaproteobacteria bacterium]|nr:Nramp family divalent metal transporter [Kofleriaceae bacterium]
MLSAAGSGELLFTPRVAALYGYALVWALVAAVALKWCVNREIGRFTVCTGATILDGFSRLPGPRMWALWAILVPQLVVAVATVAGMAGAAATALVLLTGGPTWPWTAGLIVGGATLLGVGGYRVIEKVAAGLGIALTVAVVVAAITVAPAAGELARGLVPQIPRDVQIGQVLPWLGFMLAGAAGLLWFSYWLDARGYGAASDRAQPEVERVGRLRGWLSLMTITNTLAVAGALAMAFAFLVLGAELLRPEGLVPAEDRVAATLGRLLGDVWGPVGFWFMIAAIFATFTSTTLSVQDGFSRMFADGAALLARAHGAGGRWVDRRRLQRGFLIVLVAAAPIALYVKTGGKPVALLVVAGAIEAAHIPIVAALVLYANRRALPPALQPSPASFVATVLAAAFFAVFAILYGLQLAGAMP